jgi:hypothetical protein
MAAPLLSDVFALHVSDNDLRLLNDDAIQPFLPTEFPSATVFSLDYQAFLAAQHRATQHLYESSSTSAASTSSASTSSELQLMSSTVGVIAPRCAMRVSLAHSLVGDGVVGMIRSNRNVVVSIALSEHMLCPPNGRATLELYQFEPSTGVVPLGNKLDGDRTVSLVHGRAEARVKVNATSYNTRARWSSLMFLAIRVAWPSAPNSDRLVESPHVYVSLPFVSATKPEAAVRQFIPAAAAAPAVVELSIVESFPAEAPTTGGVRVLIKGTGFGPSDVVVFDRSAVPAESGVGELICVAPPHAEGVVDIYVARPIRAGTLVTQSNRIPFTYEPSVSVLKSMYFELMARVDELERMRTLAYTGAGSPPLAPSSPTHYSSVGGGGGGGGVMSDEQLAGIDLAEAVRALAAKLDGLSPLSDPTFVLYAAQLGDVDLLRIVLPKDPRAATACARYVDENGNTALALALARNSIECICVLLEFLSPSDKIDSRGRTLIGAALAQRPTPYALLAAIRRVALTSRGRALRGLTPATSARSTTAVARAQRPVSPPRPARGLALSPPSSPPSSPTLRSPMRPVTTVVTVTPPRSSASPPPPPRSAPPPPTPTGESTAVLSERAAKSSRRLSQRGSNPFSNAFRLSTVVDLSQCTPAMWNRPTRAGYLVKRGAVRKSWRTRYFVLQRNMLFYFRFNDDEEPLGAIPLKGATVAWSTIEKGRRPNLFSVESPTVKRTYFIQAESREEAESWMSSITRAATASQMSGPFDVQQLHHATFDSKGNISGLPSEWLENLADSTSSTPPIDSTTPPTTLVTGASSSSTTTTAN